jgi:hypothetical protein
LASLNLKLISFEYNTNPPSMALNSLALAFWPPVSKKEKKKIHRAYHTACIFGTTNASDGKHMTIGVKKLLKECFSQALYYYGLAAMKLTEKSPILGTC